MAIVLGDDDRPVRDQSRPRQGGSAVMEPPEPSRPPGGGNYDGWMGSMGYLDEVRRREGEDVPYAGPDYAEPEYIEPWDTSAEPAQPEPISRWEAVRRGTQGIVGATPTEMAPAEPNLVPTWWEDNVITEEDRLQGNIGEIPPWELGQSASSVGNPQYIDETNPSNVWDSTLQTWVDSVSGRIWVPKHEKWMTSTEYAEYNRRQLGGGNYDGWMGSMGYLDEVRRREGEDVPSVEDVNQIALRGNYDFASAMATLGPDIFETDPGLSALIERQRYADPYWDMPITAIQGSIPTYKETEIPKNLPAGFYYIRHVTSPGGSEEVLSERSLYYQDANGGRHLMSTESSGIDLLATVGKPLFRSFAEDQIKALHLWAPLEESLLFASSPAGIAMSLTLPFSGIAGYGATQIAMRIGLSLAQDLVFNMVAQGLDEVNAPWYVKYPVALAAAGGFEAGVGRGLTHEGRGGLAEAVMAGNDAARKDIEDAARSLQAIRAVDRAESRSLTRPWRTTATSPRASNVLARAGITASANLPGDALAGRAIEMTDSTGFVMRGVDIGPADEDGFRYVLTESGDILKRGVGDHILYRYLDPQVAESEVDVIIREVRAAHPNDPRAGVRAIIRGENPEDDIHGIDIGPGTQAGRRVIRLEDGTTLDEAVEQIEYGVTSPSGAIDILRSAGGDAEAGVIARQLDDLVEVGEVQADRAADEAAEAARDRAMFGYVDEYPVFEDGVHKGWTSSPEIAARANGGVTPPSARDIAQGATSPHPLTDTRAVQSATRKLEIADNAARVARDAVVQQGARNLDDLVEVGENRIDEALSEAIEIGKRPYQVGDTVRFTGDLGEELEGTIERVYDGGAFIRAAGGGEPRYRPFDYINPVARQADEAAQGAVRSTGEGGDIWRHITDVVLPARAARLADETPSSAISDTYVPTPAEEASAVLPRTVQGPKNARRTYSLDRQAADGSAIYVSSGAKGENHWVIRHPDGSLENWTRRGKVADGSVRNMPKDPPGGGKWGQEPADALMGSPPRPAATRVADDVPFHTAGEKVTFYSGRGTPVPGTVVRAEGDKVLVKPASGERATWRPIDRVIKDDATRNPVQSIDEVPADIKAAWPKNDDGSLRRIANLSSFTPKQRAWILHNVGAEGADVGDARIYVTAGSTGSRIGSTADAARQLYTSNGVMVNQVRLADEVAASAAESLVKELDDLAVEGPMPKPEVAVVTEDGVVKATVDAVNPASGAVKVELEDGAVKFVPPSEVRGIEDPLNGGDLVTFKTADGGVESGRVIRMVDDAVVIRMADKTVRRPIDQVLSVVKRGEKPVMAPRKTPDNPWDVKDIRRIRNSLEVVLEKNVASKEDTAFIRSLVNQKFWTPAQTRAAFDKVNRYSRSLPSELQDEFAQVSRPITTVADIPAAPSTWKKLNDKVGPLAKGAIVYNEQDKTYYRVKEAVPGTRPRSPVLLEQMNGQFVPINYRENLRQVVENGRPVIMDGDTDALNMLTLRESSAMRDRIRRYDQILRGEQGTGWDLGIVKRHRDGLVGALEHGGVEYKGPHPIAVPNSLRSTAARLDLPLPSARLADKPVARGKDAILRRLDLEVRLKKMDSGVADDVRKLIENIPGEYLERVAVSFFKRTGLDVGDGGAQVVGRYLPVDMIVEIAKRTDNVPRTVIHEVFHHIENFLTESDRIALLSQYIREIRGTTGMFISDAVHVIDRLEEQKFLQEMLDSRQLRFTDLTDDQKAFLQWTPSAEEIQIVNDTYRYRQGFKEWFAEVMADKAMRNAFQSFSPVHRNIVQKIGYHLRNLSEAAHRLLLRKGEKDAAERVFQQIRKGGYGEFKQLPDDVEPQNLLRGVRRVAHQGGIAIPNARAGTPTPTARVGGGWLHAVAPTLHTAVKQLAETRRAMTITSRSAQEIIHGQAESAIEVLGGLKKIRVAGHDEWVVKGVNAIADDIRVGLSAPKLEDIVQEPGRYVLSPDQKDAVLVLKSLVEGVYDTARSFGVDPHSYEIFDPGGGFFPRRFTDETRGRVQIFLDDLLKRGQTPGAGGTAHGVAVGDRLTNVVNTTGRHYYSAREGIANGVHYTHPLETLNRYATENFRNSINSYTAEAAKSFGVPLGQAGRGYRMLDKQLAPALKDYVFKTPTLPGMRVFRAQDAEILEKLFDSRPNHLVYNGLYWTLTAVNAPLKGFKSMMDLSATYQHLFLHGTSTPTKAVEHLGRSLETALPVYQKRLRAEFMTSAKTFRAAQAGIVITGRAGDTPEFIFSRVFEHIPLGGRVVKHLNQHFEDFANYSRVEMFTARIEAAQAAGRTITPEYERAVAKAVNLATGVNEGAMESGGLMGLVLYAPNYYLSFLKTLTNAATKIKGLEGETGALARRSLASTMATMGVTVAAVAVLQGRDPRDVLEPWKRDSDGQWRWNPNFYTVRLPLTGTDLSLLGPYKSWFQLGSSIIQASYRAATKREFDGYLDTMEYFLRSKASPLAGYVWEVQRGKTFMGEPLEYNPFSKTGAMQWAERLVPIAFAEFMREYRANGDIHEAFVLASLGFLGLNADPMTPWETYDSRVAEHPELIDYLKKGETRLTYNNLDADGQRKAREILGDPPKTTNVETLRKYAERERIDKEFRDHVLGTTVDWRSGALSTSDAVEQWRKDSYAHSQMARDIWRESNPDDTSIIDGYFSAIDRYRIGSDVDWEAVENWLAEQPENERARIVAFLDESRKRSHGEEVGIGALMYGTMDGLASAHYYEFRDQVWQEYVTLHPELAEYGSIYDWARDERERLTKEWIALHGDTDNIDALTKRQHMIEEQVKKTALYEGWTDYWKGSTERPGRFDEWFADQPEATQRLLYTANALGLVILSKTQEALAGADTPEERERWLQEYAFELDEAQTEYIIESIIAEQGASYETREATAFAETGITQWGTVKEMELDFRRAKAIELGYLKPSDAAAISTLDELERAIGKGAFSSTEDSWSGHKKRKTPQTIAGETFPVMKGYADSMERQEIANFYAILNNAPDRSVVARAIINGQINLSSFREESLLEVGVALSGGTAKNVPTTKATKEQITAWVIGIARGLQ